MRRALFASVLLLSLWPAAVRAQDEDDGYEHKPATGVAVPFHDRPIVTPHRSMEVFVELPIVRQLGKQPLVSLQAGARHGLFEDWELGVVLWPLIFQRDGVAAGSPSVFASYRYLQTSIFEMAVGGRLGLPFGENIWLVEANAPVLLRLGPVLRLDSGLTYQLTTATPLQHVGQIPLRLSLQLADQFRIAPSAGIQITRYGAALGAGLEAAVTIVGSGGGAACDIVLGGQLSELYTTAKEHGGPLDIWTVSASARFYLYFGTSTWENDDDFMR